MPIRFAVSSSNWSNPATWDNGAVPNTDDTVYANGYTVTLDTNATASQLRNDGSPVLVPDIATPAMTSNTTPSGAAAASSGANPWAVFDQNNGTSWATTTNNTGWVSYQFTSAKTIRRYAFFGGDVNRLPRTWTFEGSNDGSTWTVLNTQTNLTLAVNTWYTYTIASPAAYTYYRINVTAVNSTGNPVQITALDMTESTGTVVANILGGTFSLANGVDFTCTAASGIIVGSSTATVTFSLASPNSATLRANIFNGNQRNITVSGTGTLNLIGNLTTNTITNPTCCVDITSTSTVNITGDLTHSTGNGSNQIAVVRAYGGGILNITGNIIHNPVANAVFSFSICGSGTSGAASTVNITGNITTTSNTGAGQAVFMASGNVTVNGNVTAGGVTAIATSAGNTTVNGNVSAGSAGGNGINTSTTGTVTVNGTVTASTTNVGIFSSSTGLITCTGNLVNNSNGMMAVNTSRLNISSGSSQTWNMFRSGGIARDLLTSDQITVTGSFPSSSDVRSGVTYALTQTGSCIIPSASAVALGVPVDNTIGTAFLSITDIANAVWNVPVSTLNTTTGSMGALLSRASTVQTTAAQIAALTS